MVSGAASPGRRYSSVMPVADTDECVALPELPTSPPFNAENCTAVYVLGGPGVGKGTQCALLAARQGFVHLSAGDLLRAERAREGSPYARVIESNIREGRIIPQRITIALLLAAMLRARNECGAEPLRFLIDGFPRDIAQGEEFEERVCTGAVMLYYDCPEDVMLERLRGRAATSGRSDDNEESIRKRLVTYAASTLPVRAHYAQKEALLAVDATASVEDVFSSTLSVLTAARIL